MTADLTARGVRTMLTRAGVDHSQITITERRVEVLWAGTTRTQVTITGPRDARRAAGLALYERGLTCAPYPDRSEWHR